jgi:hypothetical protein
MPNVVVAAEECAVVVAAEVIMEVAVAEVAIPDLPVVAL